MKINFHLVEMAMLSAFAAAPLIASETVPAVPTNPAPPAEQVQELKGKVEADKAQLKEDKKALRAAKHKKHHLKKGEAPVPSTPVSPQ